MTLDLDPLTAILSDDLTVVECCGTCDYFAPHWGGICRRWGPTAVPLPARSNVIAANGQEEFKLSSAGIWPPVKAELWCGEWAPINHKRKRLGDDGRGNGQQ